MKKLSELDDKEIIPALQQRWADASVLWEKMKTWSDHNRKYWRNQWEDPNRVARKISLAKDNRIFISLETDVAMLTGRPAKPIVIPTNPADKDSREVSDSLQRMFLDLYQMREVKKKLRKGLRRLHLDRLIVLYPFWNIQLNDVDVRVVDPKKIRIPGNASTEVEAEFVAEEIEEPIQEMLSKLPDVEEQIFKTSGLDATRAVKINQKVRYMMFWTAEQTIYVVNWKVIK